MEDQLSYGLDAWSGESRQLLGRLLTAEGITHAWQGGTLTVAAGDADAVDDLVEEVEALADSVLDPEADKVVYEVAEWSPEDRDRLVEALADEGVRHEFDDMGDLVVEAVDEDRVDGIIDLFTDDDVEDGPPVNDVLSELFVAADKLRRNARDARALGDALNAVATVVPMAPPYGFDRRTWAQVGLRAGALRVAIEIDPPDDEAVETAAAELRELLHPLV